MPHGCRPCWVMTMPAHLGVISPYGRLPYAVAPGKAARTAVRASRACWASSAGVGGFALGAIVRSLLGHGRPPAVAWLVVSVWVDSIKRVQRISARISSWGPLSHVFEEILELRPSRANQDASTSVPRIGRMLRATTAVAHRRPRRVGGRSLPPRGVSMCGLVDPTGRNLTAKAPTGFRGTTPECPVGDDLWGRPAVALAQ